MTIKELIKLVVKESKASIFMVIIQMIPILLANFLRPGSLPLVASFRKYLLQKNQQDLPVDTKMQLRNDINDALAIFKLSTVDQMADKYPDWTDCKMGEYDHVRFMVGKDKDDVYHLVIRGSDNIHNWMDNLDIDLAFNKRLRASVHEKYFNTAVGISDAVRGMIPPGSKIRIVGGSMGGSLGILIGWLYSQKTDRDQYVITQIVNVAGPKVSDVDYGHLPVINVQHIQDPVVYLPVFTFRRQYLHQGQRVILGDGEPYVLLDSIGTDLMMSTLLLTKPFNLKAHLRYQL